MASKRNIFPPLFKSTQLKLNDWIDPASISMRGPVMLVAATMLFVVIGGGLWGSLVPFSGAVISSGRVVAHGRNQIVQHLEGGIIQKILVKEGDRVTKDQPLVLLNDTAARSNLNRLTFQRDIARARLARLNAERETATEINFPKDLLERSKTRPGLKATIDSQRREFAANQNELQSQVSVFDRRAQVYLDEIGGLNSIKDQKVKQITLLQDQIDKSNYLMKQGLERSSRNYILLRDKSRLDSDVGDMIASLSKSKNNVEKVKAEKLQYLSSRLKVINKDMTEVQSKLIELSEAIRNTRFVVDRTEIKSPIAGVIVQIEKNTTSSVITPGQKILEIFPQDEVLTIEARVDPKDIENIGIKQHAVVTFPSIKKLDRMYIQGEVSYVSADVLTDPNTSTTYYVSKIELKDLDGFAYKTLIPGMTAEIFFHTKSRTFFSYIAEPLIRVVKRSLTD